MKGEKLNEYKRRKRAERGLKKGGVKPKTVAQYESEATRQGECLVHPACRVARKIYFMRHPEAATHLLVCHTCDNHYCIEDSHHFLGTSYDNIMDAVEKGRHSCFANAKLAQAKSPFGTDKWCSYCHRFKAECSC